MRASRRNFTLDYPAKRMEFDWRPPGFDMGAIVTLAHAPLDPLILECEACEHGRDKTCRPEVFFRPECRLVETEAAEFEAAAARPATREAAAAAVHAAVRDSIIAALERHGPCTIYQIAALGGQKYGSLRTHIRLLVGEGLIEVEAAAPGRRNDGSGGANKYALAE